MKNFLLAAFLIAMPFVDANADDVIVSASYTENTALTLFSNPTTFADQTSYYRIPAITLMKDGTLLGLSDVRINGTKDIGGGNAICIVAKKSTDNGQTWGEQYVAVEGGGSDFDFAHGDAAIVTDRETGEMVLLCASGTKGYAAGGCMLGQYHSIDGITWTGGDITSTLKEAFTSAGINVTKQFFTSGRIIQSSKIKVGSHYRIYSALCTGNGSIVAYSDDFGASWAVLGNQVACKGGDETVLEELPDGNLLLSARLSVSGRKFNVFTYSDLSTGTGTWGSPSKVGLTAATNCNAELLLLPTERDNIFVLLHSVSLSGRTNVTIYYKVIDTTADDYNSPSFYTSNWTVLNQMSTTTSCYSTMVLDKDGNVAYLFEENSNGGYDIQYRNFSVDVSFTSDIQNLTQEGNDNDIIYSVSGQKMNGKLQKGVYIQNGKTFIAR